MESASLNPKAFRNGAFQETAIGHIRLDGIDSYLGHVSATGHFCDRLFCFVYGFFEYPWSSVSSTELNSLDFCEGAQHGR